MGQPAQSIQSGPINGERLAEITRRIVEGFHPNKVILFGSYAWGVPRVDSDVDLLVIMESDARPAHRSAEISMACRPPHWVMDILVRTPEEMDQRMKMGDPFIREILERGIVLYEC